MEVKIQKLGNSDGIIIPKSILNALNLKTNDKLELKYVNEKLIIWKSKKEKISLEEKFANYNGENIIEDYDWGKPQGKEIW